MAGLSNTKWMVAVLALIQRPVKKRMLRRLDGYRLLAVVYERDSVKGAHSSCQGL